MTSPGPSSSGPGCRRRRRPERPQRAAPAAPLLLALASAAAALLLLSLCGAAAQCTTILAGRGATEDRSLLMARNADAGEALKPTGFYRHAALLEPLRFRSNVNRFDMELPRGAMGYVASPSFFSMAPWSHNPSFETTGVNDAGVSMTSTETIANSAAALAADPLNERSGIGEDAIVSVVLPLATSAKDGAERLGALVAARGASEGFGVAFMDKDEIWYFETASGHRWLAQRVPDDSYFVAANQGRFTSIAAGGSSVGSPDLEEFAFANGLCDGQLPFSFFDCYVRNDPIDVSYYDRPRVARLQHVYSGNDGPDYPVFLEPKKKLSVWDVMRGLRDRFEGTPGEPYVNRNPGAPWRPVSLLRTQLAHVTQQRAAKGGPAGLPEEIAFVEWVAWGMPTLSPFLPLYLRALPLVPERLKGATDRLDNTTLYWHMRKLQAVVFQDYPGLAPEAISLISKIEREAAAAAKAMERMYTATYYTAGSAAASKVVQAFTDTAVESYAGAIDSLTRRLADKAGLGSPSDRRYVEMLVEAERLYHFHKEEQGATQPPGPLPPRGPATGRGRAAGRAAGRVAGPAAGRGGGPEATGPGLPRPS